MLTEADYPFIEGQKGINPILLQPTKDPITIFSASGKPLVFRMDERQVYLAEEDGRNFRLDAQVTAGTLAFDLKTKITISPGQVERHQDLFAARFVNFALRHFQSFGVLINSVESVWKQDSVNYEDYTNAITAGQDKVTAAKNTWSGRTLGKHGFTRILFGGIRINYEDGMQPEIIALFEKE